MTSFSLANNIGASVPEVVEAAFSQARELSHLRSNFDSVPLLLLAKAMTDAAPGDLKRIGFTLPGSLSVEMAMKLAMANRPQHTGPWLALTDGYHGRSLASMGLGWPHVNQAHLAARIPITGFAYQWNSRLINPHYGWFTGYTALLAFMAGTAATAVALASVFASDIWKSPTRGHRAVRHPGHGRGRDHQRRQHQGRQRRHNTGVFFEITGSIGAAALLFFGAIFFFHHDAGFHVLVSTQRTSGGALWYGFILAALLPLYCFIGWEGAADLAEETNDPRAVTPFAMIRANYVSVGASLFMIVGFLIHEPVSGRLPHRARRRASPGQGPHPAVTPIPP